MAVPVVSSESVAGWEIVEADQLLAVVVTVLVQIVAAARKAVVVGEGQEVVAVRTVREDQKELVRIAVVQSGQTLAADQLAVVEQTFAVASAMAG